MRLATALGLHLPATLLFDYPSIEKLTDYLGELVFGTHGHPPSYLQTSRCRFASFRMVMRWMPSKTFLTRKSTEYLVNESEKQTRE